MSFQTVKYTDDAGKTWKCRLSDAVVAAQPSSPVGSTFDNGVHAIVSRTGRGFGVKPRYLNLSRTLGTAPNQYQKHDRMPVMLLADVATLTAAGTVTIGTTVWTIQGVKGESKR